MNINRIINESINKVLLENAQVQFQQLQSHYQYLEKCRQAIKSTDLTKSNKQISDFIGHEYYNFIVAVIKALYRCIRANNINESLSDYGFEIPNELYGVQRDAQKWYYDTYNFLNRSLRKNSGGYDNVNQYTNSKPIQVSGNEKLLELLTYKWPNMQKKYEGLNSYYKISGVCPAAENAKKTIGQIVQLVQQIKNNAQGTNP